MNKGVVDSGCGGVLMENSSEEAMELFETLSDNPKNSHPEGDKESKARACMK